MSISPFKCLSVDAFTRPLIFDRDAVKVLHRNIQIERQKAHEELVVLASHVAPRRPVLRCIHDLDALLCLLALQQIPPPRKRPTDIRYLPASSHDLANNVLGLTCIDRGTPSPHYHSRSSAAETRGHGPLEESDPEHRNSESRPREWRSHVVHLPPYHHMLIAIVCSPGLVPSGGPPR